MIMRSWMKHMNAERQLVPDLRNTLAPRNEFIQSCGYLPWVILPMGKQGSLRRYLALR